VPVRIALALVLVLASAASGCGELRGRKMIQEANERYRQGRYQEAVALFERAEALVPHLPVLWLNKGYTCRQLIFAGGGEPKTADSRRAADCALAAFARFGQLRPGDSRADQLSIQTLFDAGTPADLATLERLFLERQRHDPSDIEAIRGLQQVYYRGGNWPLALLWSRKAATLRSADAEAQYGVGTFIWQVLSARGGGAALAGYDPRPVASGEPGATRARKKTALPAPAAPPSPPPPAASDITGARRVQLADEGIEFLKKALALRPRHAEAMTYLALLYRQKSFALFADVPAWQQAVDSANEWQQKAALARTGAPN
jgi:tetratricopeptide (TPR) repeat protein